MDPGVYRDPKEVAFLQTIENTKIAFNIVKHFSEIAQKNDNDKHIVMNMQYTMKHLYEQIERMGREWEYHLNRKNPDLPLNSTIKGMGSLTAEEAMAIIKMRQNK
jgi:hypothetical protein